MNLIESIPKKQSSLIEVLIVEDEALIGWSLSHVLRKAGFAVTIVDSGEEAIEKSLSSHFDIVLTDYKLPNIDGFQVASKIKANFPNVPVIMMSAYGDSLAYQNNLQSSVDRFIEKPFNLAEIPDLLSRFTSNLRK
ncbi:MAG: response regulator [Ignavibacteriales bacterium]|nr:response regulator [Ignavibacteriales bacterium]